MLLNIILLNQEISTSFKRKVSKANVGYVSYPTANVAIDLISIIILYLPNKNWYIVILTFATVKIPHITAPRDTRQKKTEH